MWKDVYVVSDYKKIRIIIRNEWHPFFGGVTRTLIAIQFSSFATRNELLIGLLGFLLVIRHSK
jgi:hypothetical protein